MPGPRRPRAGKESAREIYCSNTPPSISDALESPTGLARLGDPFPEGRPPREVRAPRPLINRAGSGPLSMALRLADAKLDGAVSLRVLDENKEMEGPLARGDFSSWPPPVRLGIDVATEADCVQASPGTVEVPVSSAK